MGNADRPSRLSPAEQAFLEARVDNVLSGLKAEIIKAALKHAPMATPHEGHSVLREEFEELWEHVRADTGRSPEAVKEALQVAAMAVRYVVDLTDG